MKRVWIGVLIVLGVIAALGFVVLLGLGAFAAASKPRVPRRVVIEVDFQRGVLESVPPDPLAAIMFEEGQTLRDVIDALDAGAKDKRVKGFVARIAGSGVSLAHIQEIRDAVLRFRESGKPAIAFAETLGEFGPGTGGYYLATAFDEIHVQPSGDVGLNGLLYETEFWSGLYEKLDIVPRMDQRHEYKNAMNTYTESEYTPAHRESMQRLVDSQFSQIVRGIAEQRDRSEEEVRELFDGGPYLAPEAFELGLIDGLAYRDEVYDRVREDAGSGAELLYAKPYLDRSGRPHRKGTTVALIHGHGMVLRGSSGYSPWTGSVTMGSDTIAAAFRAAVRSPKVEAILFRVDCPGGSYPASDTIWRETIRAREAGKPVIVSMGSVAGSGGYFVAMDATRIVAQPGTITASIGVLGGKLLTRGLFDKVGITFDHVKSSANATEFSPIQDFSEAEYERFQAWLDRVYEDFTSKVAEGRGLPLDDVLELARGRIWTGEDALELGLVDELGGYEAALAAVREELGLDEDAPLRLRTFPGKGNPFDVFFGRRSKNSERAMMVALGRALTELQPTLRLLNRAGILGDSPGVLTMADEPRVP